MIDPGAAGARLLGAALRSAVPLAGGDLSRPLRIELDDGRTAVVKRGPAPRTEAAMLDAIRASGVRTPRVLAVDDTVLVLELLPSGGSLGRAWASLGARLAQLHATTGDAYGWPDRYAFGNVAVDNAPADDWPAFWARRRLLVHVDALPVDVARRVDRLAAGLGNRLPASPRAALLHGDLWGGNILVAGDDVSGLIDPACYYGDGEVDLAMLSVFDRPTDAFFDTYGALPPGHVERLVIYQLWPALVHLRLFGSAYRPMVERLLAAAGV